MVSKKGLLRPKAHKSVSKSSKIINPNRVVPKGKTHLRDRATIKRLAMYKDKPRYDKDGKFVEGSYMNRKVDEPIKRIAPDRRWFGNTRTIQQKELETFRQQMDEKLHDPYTVILRQQKLPLSLLCDAYKNAKMDLLSVEPFDDTFGPKSVRKKPRLQGDIIDVKSLLQEANSKGNAYIAEKDNLNRSIIRDEYKEVALQSGLKKGQSKRLWNELYKVIDSADVIVQVLDVRDPLGTRCKRIEDELKTNERCHKHMILVLNKCDLVPIWVTKRWVQTLSKEYPTLAFHASITNPFGKGAILQLLRQFRALHPEKRQISVGFVGYPNVGKSSIINTIRGENVCNTAPIPGETKYWKYITLFKQIFLIDCPGVVFPFGNTPEEYVLKGVVRVENLDDPTDYVGAVLSRLRPEYVVQHFGIKSWIDPLDFLIQLAKRSGKLFKKGEPDVNTAARMVLHDWQLGRLPYFVCPPFNDDAIKQEIDNSVGAQGYKADNRYDELVESGADLSSHTLKYVTKVHDDDTTTIYDTQSTSKVDTNTNEDNDDNDDNGSDIDNDGSASEYDDGLNTDDDIFSDESEKDVEIKKKRKSKRQRRSKFSGTEQDMSTLAVKQHYSLVDRDEKLYIQDRLKHLKKNPSTMVAEALAAYETRIQND